MKLRASAPSGTPSPSMAILTTGLRICAGRRYRGVLLVVSIPVSRWGRSDRPAACALAWRHGRVAGVDSATATTSLPALCLRAAQVILILAVITLVPRSTPFHAERTHTLKELRHTGAAPKFAIVFDAGSTGSRIHVFKFEQAGGELKLISDTFEQLKPGLSSFADSPEKAAASLQPLIDTALKTVPQNLQVDGHSRRRVSGPVVHAW